MVGSSSTTYPDTWDFSVGWTELAITDTARWVRCTFNHTGWLFLSELEVVGLPGTIEVGVSVDPASVSLISGQSQQFTATVTGTTDQAVSWSIDPLAGAIDAAGFYTAGTVTSAQMVTVRAVSEFDPTRSGTATVTVNPDTSEIAMVGPVVPDSGTGLSQVFRFDARPRSGDLTWVQMVFNSSLSPTSACLVYYDPAGDQVFLSADDSQPEFNTWVGSAVLGTAGASLSNSQCTIDVASSWSTSASGEVSVHLDIDFAAGWSGTKHIYMAAEDTSGELSAWPYVGYWIVP